MTIWKRLFSMANNSSVIAENLNNVKSKIRTAWEKRCVKAPNQPMPELVAVSKLQTVESIIEAYTAGQRHFGENYIQELLEKENNPLIRASCPDIKWHFIGRLQRNKANKLFTFPIYMIQSVDSLKLLDHMSTHLKNTNAVSGWKILLQVNTSGEENKGGIKPEDVCEHVRHIKNSCELLEFHGLMTIGEANLDPSEPNRDFEALVKLRDELDSKNLSPAEVTQLSMGMSADYEEAILMGSTIIRVGSAIFGARPTKQGVETTN